MALPNRPFPRLPESKRCRARKSQTALRHRCRALSPCLQGTIALLPPRPFLFTAAQQRVLPTNAHSPPDLRHQISHLRHPRLLPGQRRRQRGRQVVPRQADREGEEEGGGLDQEREELAGDHEAGEGVE